MFPSMRPTIFQISIAISMLSMSASKMLICSGPNFVQIGQSCFYIQRFVPEQDRVFMRNKGKNKCDLLGRDFKWDLPKLDQRNGTERWIVDAIQAAIGSTNWFAWIGLLRDDPKSEEEKTDLAKWADKSKWKWTIDGSTLASSYPTGAPPWYLGEPNNDNYKNPANTLKDLEQYVYAEFKNTGTMKGPVLSDAYALVQQKIPLDVDAVIICEALMLLETPPTPDSDLKWLLFTAALVMLIAGIATFLVGLRKSRPPRNQMLKKMGKPRRRKDQPNAESVNLSTVTDATSGRRPATRYDTLTTERSTTTTVGAYQNF